MSIQSSLYSGISGLTTNGNAMSVIGNNIANTNTIGFKSSRPVFSDLLSSSISGSGGESQVGRGVGLSTVDNVFAQGTFESTETTTDLAVEGSGFFMLREAGSQELQFSRAGAFRFNADGNLVNPERYYVQGYALDMNGNPVGDIIDIQVATATTGYTPANATTAVTLSTNLNSKTPYVTSNATTGSATGTGQTINALASTMLDPSVTLTIEGATITVADGANEQRGSAKNIAAGINTASIGVTASVTAPVLDLGDISLAGNQILAVGNLTINGINITGPINSGTTTAQTLRTLIDAQSSLTGVTASVGTGALILTAVDGENIQVETDGLFAEALLTGFTLTGGAAAARTAFGSVSIAKEGELVISSTLDNTYGVQIAAGTTGSDPYFDLADATGTSNYATSIRVFDSFGDTHLLTNYFVKRDPDVDPNQWDIYSVVDSGELSGGTAGTYILVGSQTMTFDTTGALASNVTLQTNAAALNWANGSDQTQQVTFTMATTQYASDFVVNSQSQDGFSSGTLVDLDIDSNGIIYGKYSNGEPRPLAQLALATFNNTGGLVKKGSNMWAATTNSGPAVIGTVGSGVGKLFTNSLEQSNVDLAQEFVKMITIQRGFQANSRVITTTDEMMSELLNLKR